MDKSNVGAINQLKFNTAYSENLKNDASYKIYQQWLQQNGAIISPKIIYPAYFGDDGKGIIGIGVSESMPAHQAIIAIPYKLIITSQKARKDLRISKMIQENPNIFGLESGSQFINIAIFLCCQLALKDKSFYSPYLNICMKNHIEKWSHWDMLAVENNEVTKQMKLQAERIEQLTKQLITIFAKYPSIFPDSISSEQYSQIIWKAYYMITTRSFGWPLPSRSLIPFADALNHSNKGYITHQLINISEKSGQNKANNKINLAILNRYEDQSKQKVSIKQTKIRRFVHKHRQLQSESKQVGFYEILWSQYVKRERNLRQLHFYQDSCQEDNDTDQQLIDKFEQEVTLFCKHEKKSNGIDNNNRNQYLIKYWHIYLDPIFKQHYADKQKSEGSEQSEQCEQQNKKREQDEQHEKQERESQKSVSSYLSSTSSSEEENVSAVSAIDQQHTYFVVATRKYQNKNDQLYNFYGRRSNQFLLVGYSFILDNNKYDSFAFRIYVDNWKINSRPFERIISPANLIAKTSRPTSMYTKQIRLKMDKINIQLINHCRALLIGWNNPKQISSLIEENMRKIKIMTPFSRQFEKDVLELARQFIRRLELQYLTSLEQDQKLLTKLQKQSSKSAIKLRMIHKRILRNQKKLLSMCEGCLQIWKDGRIQVKNGEEMEQMCKIKQYLISLQRSKL